MQRFLPHPLLRYPRRCCTVAQFEAAVPPTSSVTVTETLLHRGPVRSSGSSHILCYGNRDAAAPWPSSMQRFLPHPLLRYPRRCCTVAQFDAAVPPTSSVTVTETLLHRGPVRCSGSSHILCYGNRDAAARWPSSMQRFLPRPLLRYPRRCCTVAQFDAAVPSTSSVTVPETLLHRGPPLALTGQARSWSTLSLIRAPIYRHNQRVLLTTVSLLLKENSFYF